MEGLWCPANTVAELAEQYLASYSEQFKRPKGYRMDRWQLDAYVLPRWGDQPVDQITKRDVWKLLEDLAEGELAARGEPTKVAPRNLKALLSKMFDWGADRGLVPGNPASGVKLPDRVRKHLQKGGRDRVLSEEEIATLWEKLDVLEAYAQSREQGCDVASAPEAGVHTSRVEAQPVLRLPATASAAQSQILAAAKLGESF